MRINNAFVDDTVICESISTLCYKDRNSYFECHQQSVKLKKWSRRYHLRTQLVAVPRTG